ncbi:5-formyltetrahydrofolate cyclo-ligase [Parapedobacter defluvii]|uniref:5-formyltetrahydrofolate cyclo-ligase n=1 Tax=Parapedobacter defluvii TaxID=2045106 RepID=A0ABQ1LQ94_9SPHI|nr:5-formyltetrahydrofolate cyclo-ligase [Parapedobacter defluvii]RQP15055.1 MAG: 5-formyltetrahydrofolate cyclo-ligase [Parapedobacter sp.]GGC25423.1 5-formyltetrahydrofolate cyclo-ligase [Parapedobacter defluvii]
MQSPGKQELRKRYREKRINLSTEDFLLLNQRLLEQVHRLDMAGFSTVHLFLPIEGNREPDTYAVAEWLRHTYPHIRLVLSRTDRITHGMHHFIWAEDTLLKENHWGIPEPENGTAVSAQEIDAVFVPLLAFDIRGNRVGYGKGFYDRFLAECGPATTKIGLSLFEAEPAIGDTDVYDIPLDCCVTPQQIWDFNTIP